MSVVTRCGAIGLLIGLLVGGAPAVAQTTPTEASGSSWTDPPVRGAAGPDAPAPAEKKPEAKPSVAAAPPASDARNATPAERAATALGVKPVGSTASNAPVQNRRFAVRPRMVERPLTLYRRAARVVERPSHRLARQATRRSYRSYAFVPESRVPVGIDPYDGRTYSPTWSSRRTAGWGGLLHENPASRAARARESGFLNTRMQDFDRADDVRPQRPSLFDGFGDLD